VTTTISVIRTAVYSEVPGSAVTLDPRVAPTDNFFTASGNLTVALAAPPSGAGVGASDYDGQRFRITRSAGSGTFSVNYGAGTKSLAVNAWAEFVWTASGTTWRLAAAGTL
jgi:hypothetical protein